MTRRLRFIQLIALSVVAAFPLAAQVNTPRADSACPACADFYEYANSPSITARLKGPLSELGPIGDNRRLQAEKIKKIISASARDSRRRPNERSDRANMGRFLDACMDTARIERLGVTPLQPALQEIAAIRSPDDVFQTLGELIRNYDAGFFSVGVTPDAADSRRNIAVIAFGGGLGLQSRDVYLQNDGRYPAVRVAYLQHVRTMFELLGEPADSAAIHANTVLRMETALARLQPTNQALRDPRERNSVVPPATLDTLIPRVRWRPLLAATGAPEVSRINARYVAALRGLDSLLGSTPLEDWKPLFRWEVLNATAPELPARFAREHRTFASSLSRTDTTSSRAARCSDETAANFSRVIGQEYVRTYFSPNARRQASAMVDNLMTVLRARIRGLTWMSDSTKRAALVKLDSLVRNIGYSDQPTTDATPTLSREDYFGNRVQLLRAGFTAGWKRLAITNDRARWGNSPATPRAIYNPPYNQINATAAFLQPPAFVPGGDVAVNYGAIGAVIGHELTHVFDPIGGRFDASGNLRDWWANGDTDRYKALTKPLIEQFSSYALDSSRTVNGQTTLGENISDLGGLQIAYEAMHRVIDSKSNRRIDGFTPEQRFFLAYARHLRQQEVDGPRLDASTETHAPPKWRVNGPFSNMPEFARAWGCREGDFMFRPENSRVSVW